MASREAEASSPADQDATRPPPTVNRTEQAPPAGNDAEADPRQTRVYTWQDVEKAYHSGQSPNVICTICLDRRVCFYTEAKEISQDQERPMVLPCGHFAGAVCLGAHIRSFEVKAEKRSRARALQHAAASALDAAEAHARRLGLPPELRERYIVCCQEKARLEAQATLSDVEADDYPPPTCPFCSLLIPTYSDCLHKAIWMPGVTVGERDSGGTRVAPGFFITKEELADASKSHGVDDWPHPRSGSCDGDRRANIVRALKWQSELAGLVEEYTIAPGAEDQALYGGNGPAITALQLKSALSQWEMGPRYPTISLDDEPNYDDPSRWSAIPCFHEVLEKWPQYAFRTAFFGRPLPFEYEEEDES